VVVLGVLALLAPAQGRYDGAVVTAGGDPVYVAREHERVWLRFVDRDRAGTAYRVVVSNGPTRYGLTGRTAQRGAPSRLAVGDVGPAARVSVRWEAGGRTAGRWVFLVRPRKPGA
jgi:hypothetical protein